MWLTRPASSLSIPAIADIRVVLPEPDGPTSAVIPPPQKVAENSANTVREPNRLVACSTSICTTLAPAWEENAGQRPPGDPSAPPVRRPIPPRLRPHWLLATLSPKSLRAFYSPPSPR